ncbi:transposase [Ectopseudomonas mendocina]|nr:transposase [Pseudomonas mendocina]TRO24490.1 transposase [Pseudomonas mendocina]TRO24779.1 transposase [Pseudomonas mendocina]
MRQRSSYPKPFKVQVVQECLQPGATVSSVAIRHGINANVIRKWLPLYRDQLPAVLPAFVPLRATPKRPTAASVIIELSLGEQSVTVKWPVSDPDGCARLEQERCVERQGRVFGALRIRELRRIHTSSNAVIISLTNDSLSRPSTCIAS